MIQSLYSGAILIDTSAAIALRDTTDQFHTDALEFFKAQDQIAWFALNATAHETFTTRRYGSTLEAGLQAYDFLAGPTSQFRRIVFDEMDEAEARQTLARYKDQRLSFHDALCAAVMKRVGILNIFTFDKDFWVLGFQVLPGNVRG